MAKIVLNEFTGIMPKVANDKLPINMAQIAQDLSTATKELRAIKKSTPDIALAGSSYKTMFQYTFSGSPNWVYLDDIIFWSRSPVADDSFERVYMNGWTAVGSSGTITFTDGITDGQTITIGTEIFEFDVAPDGVAGTNTVVDVSASQDKEDVAAVLAALTPKAAVTFTDNLDGTITVTATATGKNTNEIVLSKSGANITVTGSGYLTGGTDTYRAFSNDINSAPWDFDVDFYYPGADAGAAPTIASSGGGTDYRAYFYTYVSRYGEEGPGSAIGEITDYDSGRVTVDVIAAPRITDTHLTTAVGTARPKVRIYRTASGTDGTADFLLVCEADYFDVGQAYAVGDFVIYETDLWECTTIHPAGAWNAGHFDQGELVSTSILTGTNESYLYRRCPNDLTNLRSHPNGFFVASKGKKLYFSEPFAPWAWPEDYEIPLDATVVGIGIFGSTIVVATDANIYTFSGPHPDSLYKQRLAFQPCLSQRGVVETDLGVMFPSAEGFQLVAADSSPNNVTADWFNPDDWVNYELETLHGVWYNKAYYGFYKSADYEGNIIIDFVNNSITTGNEYHYAADVSISDGIFRTIKDSSIISPDVLYISKWDADTARYRNYTYKSPRFILEKPVNFKVAQIIIDTDFYNQVLDIIAEGNDITVANQATWDDTDWGAMMGGPVNDYMANAQDINGDDLYSLTDLGVLDYIEFSLYVDGVLKFTKQVMDSTMFKLPRGFKDKKWEVEVKGMMPVKRIILATSTEEIRNG